MCDCLLAHIAASRSDNALRVSPRLRKTAGSTDKTCLPNDAKLFEMNL